MITSEKMVRLNSSFLILIRCVFVAGYVQTPAPSDKLDDGSVKIGVDTSNSPTEECSGVNALVCRDPIGQYCFESKCICREDHPIKWEGVCLKNASLGHPCWVSQQCSATTANTVCMRSSGRVLHDIFEPLWEVFLKSNGNSKYIPGKCGCDPEYKLQVVLNRGFYGPTGPAFNTCMPRSIGSSCKTNYECAYKTRFSRCHERKCVCPSPEFEHQYSTDECVPAKKVADCTLDDEPCVTTEKEGGILARIQWSNDVAGIVGFAASMGLVLLVWSVCCKFSGSEDSDYAYNSPGQPEWSRRDEFSRLDEDGEGDETTDDEPPSYDDALFKKVSSQPGTSATFRNPSAINNS